MHLSLVEAFGRFGSKPYNRAHALSAIATDGAMVLNCSPAYFGRPAQGVLRYEDRLSREVLRTRPAELLGQHTGAVPKGAAQRSSTFPTVRQVRAVQNAPAPSL
jgi:hypothetical protein